MLRVLVSACLLGERVRYDGGSCPTAHPSLARWAEEGRVVPFCPEMAGGLPAPRPPAERVGATVVTDAGADVTEIFRRGAQKAVAEALRHGVRIAVLKEASPSCGTTYVYDGTFTHTRRAGMGVAAELLFAAGIEVFSEHTLDAAAERLAGLEQDAAPAR